MNLSMLKTITAEVTSETMDRIHEVIGEELFHREAGGQVIIDLSANRSELLDSLDVSNEHEASLKEQIISFSPSLIELSA